MKSLMPKAPRPTGFLNLYLNVMHSCQALNEKSSKLIAAVVVALGRKQYVYGRK